MGVSTRIAARLPHMIAPRAIACGGTETP